MRVFVPDMEEFFEFLDREGYKYAVLRRFFGFEKTWPKLPKGAEVDMLIQDGCLSLIFKKYGHFKKDEGFEFDIYNVSGEGRGSEMDRPYFPEKLCTQIFENRRKYHDLFYVPSAQDHLLSLLYHVTYRKCIGRKHGWDTDIIGGIHMNDPTQSDGSSYKQEIDTLLNELGITLEPTLVSYHQYLKDHGFGIDFETLIKYVQKDFTRKWKGVSFFYAHIANEYKGELNLFVIRNVAVKKHKHQEFLERLRENYDILAVKNIPFLTRLFKGRRMRGGKWRRGGYPAIAVVVYDPEPVALTAEDKEIFKHVFNARQFIKRGWRDWFTKETGAKPSANPIHSTDNEAEALSHFPLFFTAEEEQNILNKLSKYRQ